MYQTKLPVRLSVSRLADDTGRVSDAVSCGEFLLHIRRVLEFGVKDFDISDFE